MIQIIAGSKGKGKTPILLDKANTEASASKGSVVYLDKNSKHMYELNRNVRLINIRDYFVDSPETFLGFVCGMASQDHDLEKVFLDSFLALAGVEGTDIDYGPILDKLEIISAKFHIDFVISICVDGSQIPDRFKDKVIVSL